MNYTEHAIVFNCAGCRLISIVTQPEAPTETGVIIVVGGPQYRAGSHRQFTLLARQLAEQGIASMRFDYRGMGDSEGEMRNFEMVDDDIRAATDCFYQADPQLKHVVLWGLCDAASAALYYAHTDQRVRGLILLNPWAHTESSAARMRFKHYYLSRLLQRSFWVKLLSGKFNMSDSIGDLTKSAQEVINGAYPVTSTTFNPKHRSLGYIERMAEGLAHFQGKVLYILSENDLTAQEFIVLIQKDKHWKKLCRAPNVSREIVMKANHTFSSRLWRDIVADSTVTWLNKLSYGDKTYKH